VIHKTTKRFWKCYFELPSAIQSIADENFELLKIDHRHPSLQFKKVGKFWSARIGLNFRALAVPTKQGFTWVWIGTHEEYDSLLRKP